VVMGIEPKACTHQASVLPLILRMTLNSWSSFLSFSSAGIRGVYHQTQLWFFLFHLELLEVLCIYGLSNSCSGMDSLFACYFCSYLLILYTGDADLTGALGFHPQGTVE
jgi:hypothetical protein